MEGEAREYARAFFSSGTVAQYEFVFNLYEEALKLKAQQKNKKVTDFLKLDKWFQVELPKKIKSRGKDAHLVHEELVQCMKWKLARGKFSPRIKDLVQMNTPRLCITETKKAFRALLKKADLSSAIQALCNLKGVGPAMASVMLTAADHTACGFMADECLLAIPEIEGIDYTTKELLNFVEQLKNAANRLNNSGGSEWNAHKVEQTLWTLSVVYECQKALLDAMPKVDGSVSLAAAENGTATQDGVKNGTDGEISSDYADSKDVTSNGTTEPRPAEDDDSYTNDSSTTQKTLTNKVILATQQEDTNDSIATSGCSEASGSPAAELAVQSPEEEEEDSNSGLLSNGNGTKAVTRPGLEDDANTNDSLAMSESTSDSITENNCSEKRACSLIECGGEEPSAKKPKVEE